MIVRSENGGGKNEAAMTRQKEAVEARAIVARGEDGGCEDNAAKKREEERM